ncbi:MAG: helix-turn-helix domain-containing protein [Acidimicrobiales bacterium]
MTTPHLVVASLSPGTNAFELAVACEVFGLVRPEVEGRWYDFLVAGTSTQPVALAGGMTVTPGAGIDAFDRADTIVVPNATTVSRPACPPELGDALRRAHARGARIISYCSGAFALAEAGLLDGRPATTHWCYAERLMRMWPTVDLRPDVLYVDDGDILTSAGTAAAIDVSLHVVRQDHGAEVANLVARRMVVPPHRDGGQAQFIARPVVEVPEAGHDLAPTLDWILANLAEPLTVDDMARAALMSPRTFARRFLADVGETPLQWLIRQRVHHAQELLETTDLGLDRIATECGFGSAATLRQHFARVAATTPSAYRRTFQQRVQPA